MLLHDQEIMRNSFLFRFVLQINVYPIVALVAKKNTELSFLLNYAL